jgi:hypothetical protein
MKRIRKKHNAAFPAGLHLNNRLRLSHDRSPPNTSLDIQHVEGRAARITPRTSDLGRVGRARGGIVRLSIDDAPGAHQGSGLPERCPGVVARQSRQTGATAAIRLELGGASGSHPRPGIGA